MCFCLQNPCSCKLYFPHADGVHVLDKPRKASFLTAEKKEVHLSLTNVFLLKGLIPANGEIWRVRRRALVPALHKKYLDSMINLFGDCGLHGAAQLERV